MPGELRKVKEQSVGAAPPNTAPFFLEIDMTEQELVIDRAFDVACLSVADPEWSKEIYNKLVDKHPLNKNYIDGCIRLYKMHLEAGADYVICRRDYLVGHKEKVKLRF